MKPWVYPWESLLRLKKQHERMAELRVAHAQAALEREKSRVAAIQDRIARASNTPRLPSDWAAAADLTHRLMAALAEAEQSVGKATAAVDAAEAERLRCAIDVETFETHREQLREEHRLLENRAHQADLDDTTINRWRRTETAERGPTSDLP